MLETIQTYMCQGFRGVWQRSRKYKKIIEISKKKKLKVSKVPNKIGRGYHLNF